MRIRVRGGEMRDAGQIVLLSRLRIKLAKPTLHPTGAPPANAAFRAAPSTVFPASSHATIGNAPPPDRAPPADAASDSGPSWRRSLWRHPVTILGSPCQRPRYLQLGPLLLAPLVPISLGLALPEPMLPLDLPRPLRFSLTLPAPTLVLAWRSLWRHSHHPA